MDSGGSKTAKAKRAGTEGEQELLEARLDALKSRKALLSQTFSDRSRSVVEIQEKVAEIEKRLAEMNRKDEDSLETEITVLKEKLADSKRALEDLLLKYNAKHPLAWKRGVR